MKLSADQTNHLEKLIISGEQLAAVKMLQESLNMNLEEAHRMVEQLSSKIKKQRPTEVVSSQKSGGNAFPIVGIAFVSVGLLLLGIGIYLYQSNQNFKEYAIPLQAVVIDYQEYRKDGSTTYSCVYEYEYAGKSYKITSSTSSTHPAFNIGEEVEILVDPENPSKILINSFVEEWLGILILAGMGIMFSVLGMVFLMIFRKK